MEDLFHAMK